MTFVALTATVPSVRPLATVAAFAVLLAGCGGDDSTEPDTPLERAEQRIKHGEMTSFSPVSEAECLSVGKKAIRCRVVQERNSKVWNCKATGLAANGEMRRNECVPSPHEIK